MGDNIRDRGALRLELRVEIELALDGRKVVRDERLHPVHDGTDGRFAFGAGRKGHVSRAPVVVTALWEIDLGDTGFKLDVAPGRILT